MTTVFYCNPGVDCPKAVSGEGVFHYDADGLKPPLDSVLDA